MAAMTDESQACSYPERYPQVVENHTVVTLGFAL